MSHRAVLGAVAVTMLASSAAIAGTEPYFNPLTQSTVVAPPNHFNETNSPWQTPPGISQVNLMSMAEVEADVNQSIQRVPLAGRNASMFDMIAYGPRGRYLFIPHETPWGAGVSRYDTRTDTNKLLFAGDLGAITDPDCESDPEEPREPTKFCQWAFDFAAFDPARWTPNRTVIAAEEWSGLGRVVEILKPMGPAPADAEAAKSTNLVEGKDYRVLESIAKVAHEGINFSEKHRNKVIYFIDEWNSGSIYKLVLKRRGDYTRGGQTFVLVVDSFIPTGGDPTAFWNEGPNTTASRFGPARWVPITDRNGNPLPGITDPFRDGPTNDPRSNDDTRGGRIAADDVGGTPYGRPEDMEVGMMPNGNEVLYITTTSEAAVISVENLRGNRARVRQFAKEGETPKNVGFAATTGILNSPDNLAQDALGNIYIIEDSPNSGTTGGDIWFARDTDMDGVAESLDHFLSLQVNGSESTGMVFHPRKPTKFVVAVQHPESTNLDTTPGGFGDAVWEFDIKGVVPPPCERRKRRNDDDDDDYDDHDYGYSEGKSGMIYNWRKRRWVQACSDTDDFNFVKVLERVGRPRY